MHATFQAEKPKEIEFTLTMTMTLENWMRLQSQLKEVSGTPSPSWELSIYIRNMVDQAKQVYFPEYANLAKEPEECTCEPTEYEGVVKVSPSCVVHGKK